MKEEARKAKELRDRGMTWGEVAKKLNQLGYKTKKGLPICDKYASLLVINEDPSYRSYERKTRRRKQRRVVSTYVSKNATANETAIDLILSSKNISIKDRLEIALKLL